MRCAPEQERVRRAVPQATEDHGDQQIAVGRDPRPAVTSERDVEVVPQPVRQRNVPSSPELGDVARQIGLFEVNRQVDTE